MFSALAMNHGGLKDKINLFIAICPITNIHYSLAPLGDLPKSVVDALVSTVNTLNIWEILGPNWLNIGQAICGVFPCDAILQLYHVASAPWNDPDISFIANYRASEASSRQLIHYVQT